MNTDIDRDTNIDMDAGPAEIYADRFDCPRKFAQRGIIPRRNLAGGLWYPTEICLKE
jgi:hypothetical protein